LGGDVAASEPPTTTGKPGVTNGGADSENIGKWLSLLVGALSGAFAFLGIRGEEVSNILRNQRWEASVVAMLLVAALALSIVGFFVGEARIPVLLAVALLVGTIAISPFMVFAIATLPKNTDWAHGSSLVVSLFLLGLAIILAASWLIFRYVVHDGLPKAGWPARLVVLLMSVLLIATAIYSSLRLETRSQNRTTSPQVSASYVTSDNGTIVKVSVRVDHLRSADYVNLLAQQLVRDPSHDIVARCSETDLQSKSSATMTVDAVSDCQNQPCLVLTCQFVAAAQLRPDSFGKIHGSFEFPIDAKQAEHVVIQAALCIRSDPQGKQETPIVEGQARQPQAMDANTDDGSGGCTGRVRKTELEVRIPSPQ
jgi:hypothetical protein